MGITKLKVALLTVWILLSIISAIEHFYYHKEMSVWSATLSITLLLLAFSVKNIIPKEEVTTEDVSKIIVEKLAEYVNGLDISNLGIPMMDEVAVLQMENIVEQILTNPSKEVEMPEYD